MSSVPIHSKPTAAVWYGSDSAFVSKPSTERRGWGQSQESAAVISWPDVSVLPLIVLVVSPGAMPPTRRTVGNRVRHDGVPRLPKSLRAIPHGSAVRIPAGRHKESPSLG